VTANFSFKESTKNLVKVGVDVNHDNDKPYGGLIEKYMSKK
jgi:hypothetical protein